MADTFANTTVFNINQESSDLAAALGIPPSTFTGQEAKAYVAMGIISKFPRLTKDQRDAALRGIDQQFGNTSPAFPLACSYASSVFVANPDWSITEASAKGLMLRLKVENVLVSLAAYAQGLGQSHKSLDVLRGKTAGIVKASGLLIAFKVVASLLQKDRDDTLREAQRRQRAKQGVTEQDLVLADMFYQKPEILSKFLKYSPIGLFTGG